MLGDAVLAKLNEQIGHEFESANIYLQMSSWCASHGFEGCATFLRGHSAEEMLHMFKLFDYVNETGSMAIIPALSKPRAEFESVREVFEATLEHEQFITGKINELVDVAFGKKDFSTFNLLQWFVAEQHEEEKLFRGILDRFTLAGSDGRGLFMLDQEVGRLRGAAAAGAAPAGEPGGAA